MSVELLVNVTPRETRVARVENGLAEDIYIERERERGLRGNIYKGRVQRVLPGIQAAFVDIGLSKAGFLYAGDIAVPEDEMSNLLDHSATETPMHDEENEQAPPSRRNVPPIADLLKEGQEIVVQVSKDPIAQKGPRLTSAISLAGRYLVYLPNIRHVGIARRIESQEERERLLEIGEAIAPENGGLIMRTVAEDHHLFDFQQDLGFLTRLWGDIDMRLKKSGPASLVHMELNLYLRVMRDYVDDEVEKIHVDSRDAYQRMKAFAKQFMPEVAKRLYYYPGQRPLFDVYGVEREIERALMKQVKLKSGGTIVIEQTEALTAIDVNSGSFISSRNLEETSLKTNLEAVYEIVHQLRIRNIGGVIVVDFIDMLEEESRQRLLHVLKEALSRDKSKSNVVQFSELGLVEMTRKRTRDSLGRVLLRYCPHCEGIGHLKSLTTICYQIFRELVSEARAYPCNKMTIIAHPDLIDLLLGEESEGIAQVESFLGKTVSLKSDAELAPENYEIILV